MNRHRGHRSFDHFPKNWPHVWCLFDLGYPVWEERHGGWSKREVAQLSDPIDSADPFPPEEHAAMSRLEFHELENGGRS